jgi:hypothetical protein
MEVAGGNDMADSKLKVKVGEHEFEAEGSTESVQRQFEAWKELIATAPRQSNDSPASGAKQAESEQGTETKSLALDKIFRAEGRVISLTAPANSEQEAALLILLGQRHYRANESVTGSEVMDGLQQSGYRVPRVDRMLDGLSTEGLVVRTGMHRATRYRLTNLGVSRAMSIAEQVIGRF